MGCLNEITFFGEDSLEETGFATCSFEEYEFDNSFWSYSPQARTKDFNHVWSYWMHYREQPLKCDISQKPTSLQNIQISVCKGDNSGSKDTLILELENDSGDKCMTDPLDNFIQDKAVSKSKRNFDKKGNKCSMFRVSQTTKVRLFNKGKT